MTHKRCFVYSVISSDEIYEAFLRFYAQLEHGRQTGSIGGLLGVEPFRVGGLEFDKRMRDKTLPKPFIADIYHHLCNGTAILTTWENSGAIDDFVNTEMHRFLVREYFRDGEGTILTIIQHRDGETRIRYVGGTLGNQL